MLIATCVVTRNSLFLVREPIFLLHAVEKYKFCKYLDYVYGKLFENCFSRRGVTSFLMKFSQNFICVLEALNRFPLCGLRAGERKRENE